jgi:hypothetical protein
MSEQQNLELVRRAYEAFGRGDLNELLSLFDENIEWITPGPADLPTAGRRTGRQAVGEFFKSLDETFETLRFEPKEFIAQGDRVIVIGEDTSRMRATGTTLEFDWVHTFRVQNGRIVAFREYGDTAAAVEAFRAAHAATA